MDWLNGIDETGVIFRHSHQKFSLIRINVECKAIAVGKSSGGRGGAGYAYWIFISHQYRLAFSGSASRAQLHD